MQNDDFRPTRPIGRNQFSAVKRLLVADRYADVSADEACAGQRRAQPFPRVSLSLDIDQGVGLMFLGSAES